jgi:hypothetical protein
MITDQLSGAATHIRIRSILLVLLTLSISACAHIRPKQVGQCDLVGYKIVVGAGEKNLVGGSGGGATDFRAMLPQLLGRNVKSLVAGTSDKVLVLSGGSLHGAFGAGFFRGLPNVPLYRVVTGVSSGAIQSPFIFLANHKPEKEKVYPSYMHADPRLGKPGDGYPSDLALAYAVSREGDLLKLRPHGYVDAVIDGSLATFDPLRRGEKLLISEDMIRQIAEESKRGRSLLVGVTDLDEGVGYAIDLTRLADEAVSRSHVAEARDCFVEAVVASATVPPGVPPVTLKVNGKVHLFMDGGAKFGVFYQQIREAVASTPSVDMDLVVNGKLFDSPWLENGKPVGKWSLINFGFRAVDAMETEVYSFSVIDVARFGEKDGRFRVALISDAGLTGFPDDPDQYASCVDGKTCAVHHDQDAKAKPQQFYPSYMRCLIDYGQKRGEENAWNPPSALIHP